MVWNTLLALFNGGLIGLNRVMNARVGLSIGAPGASLWNHVVGFLFLIIMVAAVGGLGSLPSLRYVPSYALLGGVIGASFVALNSYVFPKLGATRTTLLIVAGEMIVGCWIDSYLGNIKSLTAATVGVLFVLIGTYLPDLRKG